MSISERSLNIIRKMQQNEYVSIAEEAPESVQIQQQEKERQ